ncbi:MAG: cysteine--tRNA ligase [Chitinophagales bacterium]|nr:cysteine--tRNA ligase [Chitinophagales bacterium]MDW8394068.1 cysteine--tRNA ligase [Chitinophagales bacterium]
MPLHLYNSLSRQKELFEPLYSPHVGMYVCGPTVSGESHLGHARPYVFFDVVFRWLRHLGYQVRYVRNITDAGHFEEEDRPAEDKVAAKAKLERLEPMELVQKYTNLFHDAMGQLNNLPPSIEPTATGHIIEQIGMIEEILRKGWAYEVNGSVYFDVVRYARQFDYGRLSGRKLDELIAGSRELEGQEEKRHPADFALWKKAPPGHLMRWPSPWGEGFPGWHIECSAMATKYLGAPFDIHGGGMDLQFPHHESEMAQTRIATGHIPARYWMHNNMITVNGRKMGKSYNNTITLRELFTGTHPLLEQAYSPMTVRFFILQAHYRSTLDFNNDALRAAEKGLQRLMEALRLLQRLELPQGGTEQASETDRKVGQLLDSCVQHMNDDFNTASTLAALFDIASYIFAWHHRQADVSEIRPVTLQELQRRFPFYITEILGLKPSEELHADRLERILHILIDLRNEARRRRDFASADRIRQQLLEVGIALKDEHDGTRWEWT